MNKSGNNRNTAIALGFFDGVHKGHQAVLAQAVSLAEQYGLEPCAFTFTTGRATPDSKRGYAAVTTAALREKLLLGCGIRQVFCPEFDTLRDLSGEEFVGGLLAREYGARAICCGGDFHFGKGACYSVDELRELCDERGIVLSVVPAVQDNGAAVSSTRVRELLAAGDIPTANRLLGRCYGFAFEVVHGRRLGRTIGTPTINQVFPEGLALPRFGVYAAFAQVRGKLYPAVANIGVKPTVVSGGAPLAETHIIGADGDLYGEVVPVYLLELQRTEEKFESLEKLASAIERDVREALRICHDFTLQNGEPVLYL